MKATAQKRHNRGMYSSDRFVEPYLDSFARMHRDSFGRGVSALPKMEDMEMLEEMLVQLFFPGHQGVSSPKSLRSTIEYSMESTTRLLYDAITRALRYEHPERSEEDCAASAEAAVDRTAEKLPEIRRLLKLDAEAGLEGDPAAHSVHEVILCYPALRALTVHRVAHFLYTIGIPLIPRMMNEIMHSRTGIDIHPGATIGESFFIDHGTGVVIGETTVIGSHVKLYQGVTLGALSIPKKGCGLLLEGAKRHPTIEDNVTIYANATILGDITIGHDTVIASNAWIKDSIPPESIVITARPEIKVRPMRKQRP